MKFVIIHFVRNPIILFLLLQNLHTLPFPVTIVLLTKQKRGCMEGTKFLWTDVSLMVDILFAKIVRLTYLVWIMKLF
jgi:hypothetical protein